MESLLGVIRFPLSRLVIWLGITVGAAFLFMLLRPSFPFFHLILSAAALIGYVVVVRWIERRPLAEAGFSRSGSLRESAAGFGLGALLLTLVIGSMAVAGWYRVTAVPWQDPLVWRHLGTELWIFLWVAVFEELAFRGVIFRLFEELLGSWLALGLSAAIFGLLHLSNPNASLLAAVAIAVEAGILLGAAFMLTRNLWLAIGIHWAWNWVQGPVFGQAVSGGQGAEHSLVRAAVTGPELWTGGAFGPEAGLAALIICTAAGLLMLRLAVRRGQAVAPVWLRERERTPTA